VHSVVAGFVALFALLPLFHVRDGFPQFLGWFFVALGLGFVCVGLGTILGVLSLVTLSQPEVRSRFL
jgi:hypothetical protein